jgi:hypothetical protein
VILEAATIGLNSVSKEIQYQVCYPNSILLTTDSKMGDAYVPQSSSSSTLISTQIIPLSDIESTMVSSCELCPIDSYRLVDSDGIPYTGDFISLDDSFNIIVSTVTPFKELGLWVEASIDLVTSPTCSFIESNRVRADYIVCGTEVISTITSNMPYEIGTYTQTSGVSAMSLANITEFFRSDSDRCSAEVFELREFANTEVDYSKYVVIDPNNDPYKYHWSRFLSLDGTSDNLLINWGTFYQPANNSIYELYLHGSSLGGKSSAKKFSITFIQNATAILATEIVQQFIQEVPVAEEEVPTDWSIAVNIMDKIIEKVEEIFSCDYELAGEMISIPDCVYTEPVVNDRTQNIAPVAVVDETILNFELQLATMEFAPVEPGDPEVSFEVGSLSREGKIAINFNQDLVVPPFAGT